MNAHEPESMRSVSSGSSDLVHNQTDSNPLILEIPQITNIEIISFLGQGGMSTVYKARQIDLDRIVAVKVLSTIRDASAVKRFRKEAKLASSLHHPNIIKTYGFDVSEDGQPYIILEFIDGESLSQVMKRNKQLSLKQFGEVFVPVLDALEIAHQKGLIHRDLKPGNIMLCKSNNGSELVKLVDFGLAKQYGSKAETKSLTGTGDTPGTPQYMSPEQCQGTELDNRSDIYAISCVMYEALLGEPVFHAESALSLMQKHYQQPPPSSKTILHRFNVDKELISAIIDGLAKDPAKRPQSAREMARRIALALESQIPTEIVVPRKRLSPVMRNAIIISIFFGGLIIGFVANKPIVEFFRAKSSPVSNRHLDVDEANKIYARGDYAGALKIFDDYILTERQNRLISYNRPRQRQVGNAYFGASKCIQSLKLPLGTLAEPGCSGTWRIQSNWYADTAKKFALESNDRQLYILSQRQKALIYEPSTKQQIDIILQILDETESKFPDNSLSPEFIEFKQEQLTGIVNAITIKQVDTCEAVQNTILQSLEKYKSIGKDSVPYLRGQAIYALFLVNTNKTRQGLEILQRLKKGLYSKEAPSLPLVQRCLILSPVWKALENAKNPVMAEEFLALEKSQYASLYEKKQIEGDLHCSLGKVYLASEDHQHAISAFLEGLDLCSKDPNPDMTYINNPNSPFGYLNILSPEMNDSQKARFERTKQIIWKLPNSPQTAK